MFKADTSDMTHKSTAHLLISPEQGPWDRGPSGGQSTQLQLINYTEDKGEDNRATEEQHSLKKCDVEKKWETLKWPLIETFSY